MSGVGASAHEPLRLPLTVRLPYDYAVGRYGSRFMTALRDEGKFYGTRDPVSGAVLVPPRPINGMTGEHLDEWVEVGPAGTVTGCTIVETPFVDPMTGRQRPIPYGFAFIRLDGADTNIYHFLEASRHEDIRVGMRVEAVFKPRAERVGSLADVICFRTLEP